MPTAEEVKKAYKRARAERRKKTIALLGPRVRLASCSTWNLGESNVTVRMHCGHVKRLDRFAAFPTGGGEFFASCHECPDDRAADIFAHDDPDEE